MSSHRDAPGTAMDPAVDSTDLFAFVSPDAPTTVTLICNYIPFQTAGGPNFHEFAEDVRYSFHISNRGTADADVTYSFRFKTTVVDKTTFRYATGTVGSPTSAALNRRQTYSVTRTTTTGGVAGSPVLLASDLTCPPSNVGSITTPNYQPNLAAPAVHAITGGRTVFAGQRCDPFFGDLGSIYDQLRLRPLGPAHATPLPAQAGIDTAATFNVHTIALRVPISDLRAAGASPSPVIGVWATAERQRVTIRGARRTSSGPWVQVSRIGNPFFNAFLVPMASKDAWNTKPPAGDSAYAAGVLAPEIGTLLPQLYPGAFPNLAAFNAGNRPRTDLKAVLLTGLPAVNGITTSTGSTQADMLRLNTSVAPTSSPNPLGLFFGDTAGYPNGRRVGDDVTTIMLRLLAGYGLPVTYPTYVRDSILSGDAVRDGTSYGGNALSSAFPYVGSPWNSSEQPHS
ncbi:MAG: DUF4331 domain-containing protein [Solirubrobacteraceae bacterium]|nr:DUF4331 domain-containing protein [Patulibacter sp.]